MMFEGNDPLVTFFVAKDIIDSRTGTPEELDTLQELIENCPEIVNMESPDEGETLLGSAVIADDISVVEIIVGAANLRRDIVAGISDALDRTEDNKVMLDILQKKLEKIDNKSKKRKADETFVESNKPKISKLEQQTAKMNAELANKIVLTPEQIADGKTVLHVAAEQGRWEYVRALLVSKTIHGKGTTDVNAQDNSGKTALHYAVINNHPETTTILLTGGSIDRGARLDDPNSTSSRLRKNGANPNAKDHEARTALSYALGAENIPMMNLLLDHGANHMCLEDHEMEVFDVYFPNDNEFGIYDNIEDIFPNQPRSTTQIRKEEKSKGSGNYR